MLFLHYFSRGEVILCKSIQITICELQRNYRMFKSSGMWHYAHAMEVVTEVWDELAAWIFSV